MASFSSTLRAVLEMDLSPFKRAAAQAPGIAGEMSKQLARKLGTGDVTKALLASLAIDAKSIAEKLAAAIQGGSEEGWTKALEAAKKYDDAVLDLIRSRMTEERRMESIRDEARLKDQEAADPRRKNTLGASARGALAAIPGLGLFAGSIADQVGVGGAESESDAITRQKTAAARAIELRKQAEELERKLQDERQKGLEAYEKLTEKIWKTRRSAAFEEASNSEKFRMLQEDVAAAQQTVTTKVAGTIERREAEVELAEAELALSKEKARQEKEAAEQKKKSDDERTRGLKMIADLEDKIADAKEKQRKAQREYSDALNDQTAATFSEIRGGTRGTTEDQRRAREVERLERQARRYRDNPENIYDERLSNGDRLRVRGRAAADLLQGRANRLRGSIDTLNSAERDPLKAYKEALAESEKQLKAISDKLTSTPVE